MSFRTKADRMLQQRNTGSSFERVVACLASCISKDLIKLNLEA
jgi:hypothetical protein